MRLALGVLVLSFLGCSSSDNPLLCTDNCDAGSGGGSVSNGGGTSSNGGGTAPNGGGTAATGGGAASSGGGSGSTGGGSASTGGGTSSSGGGTSSSGGGSGVGGGAACVESWVCTGWEGSNHGTSRSSTATRTCIDVNACGTTTMKPTEGPVTLPTLDFNYYQCVVQPILARSCSQGGCHGTLAPSRPYRTFARGRQRNAETISVAAGVCSIGAMQVNLLDDSHTASNCANLPLTNTEWNLDFDAARCFTLDAATGAMNAGANADLRIYPLRGNAVQTHGGYKPLVSGTADDTQLTNWLTGSTLATCDAGQN